jgi:plasmid stabilization system protein ParE
MKPSKRSSQKKEFKIEWHPAAVEELSEIESYILQYSVQGSENVVHKILGAVDSLHHNPERFQRDKELKEEFRRVLVGRYKIVFEINIAENLVRILSVWNTKWNPNEFLKISRR